MGTQNRSVVITLDRRTRGSVQTVFDKGLFLSSTATAGGVITTSGDSTDIKWYTSLSGVAEDFADTTAEYKAALAYYQMTKSPKYFAIAGWDIAGAETATAALTRIANIDNSWKCMCTDILLNAANQSKFNDINSWCMVNEKFAFTASTAISDLTASVTASLGKLGLTVWEEARTASGAAGYKDVSLMSQIMGHRIGSYTVPNLRMDGVIPEAWTITQEDTIIDTDHYGTTIVSNGGIPIAIGGRTAAGYPIDEELGLDWFITRLREKITQTQIDNPKIPYTNPGLGMYSDAVKSVCLLAKDYTFLDKYIIEAIPVEDVDPADRADRSYSGLALSVRPAGAIEFINIALIVEV